MFGHRNAIVGHELKQHHIAPYDSFFFLELFLFITWALTHGGEEESRREEWGGELRVFRRNSFNSSLPTNPDSPIPCDECLNKKKG